VSRGITNIKGGEQLTLSADSDWGYFAGHPDTIRLEETAEAIADSGRFDSNGEHQDGVRDIQILLSSQAFKILGLEPIKHEFFDNGYSFTVQRGIGKIALDFYQASISVRSWTSDDPTMFKVWHEYENREKQLQSELSAWYAPQVGEPFKTKGSIQAERLYNWDQELFELCETSGFKKFNLRTSSPESSRKFGHKVVATSLAVPVAMSIANMPIADSFPITAPGRGDIKVIEHSLIATQDGCFWRLESDKFVKVTE
jgi:hypothetical protein